MNRLNYTGMRRGKGNVLIDAAGTLSAASPVEIPSTTEENGSRKGCELRCRPDLPSGWAGAGARRASAPRAEC